MDVVLLMFPVNCHWRSFKISCIRSVVNSKYVPDFEGDSPEFGLICLAGLYEKVLMEKSEELQDWGRSEIRS